MHEGRGAALGQLVELAGKARLRKRATLRLNSDESPECQPTVPSRAAAAGEDDTARLVFHQTNNQL